jgi:hypothetical protein
MNFIQFWLFSGSLHQRYFCGTRARDATAGIRALVQTSHPNFACNHVRSVGHEAPVLDGPPEDAHFLIYYRQPRIMYALS